MVDRFLRNVTDAIFGNNDRRSEEEYNDYDRPVRPASEDPYGDPADVGMFGNVRPASEDPYGDPADGGMFGNVRPASEDPYGDPADVGMFPDIRPASEDPYGDPADQESRW
ncbi:MULTISPECIES: translation initiation factor [Aerosakkonema]|uniref:translation initiation factor n=1 Tax=Aerosakkonema TaxID=1246629 RepID=UPI0035BAE5FB